MSRCLRAMALAAAVLALSAGRADALDAARYTHTGGLTVVFVERHNLPFVVMSLLVKSGQADEPAEKAGLAGMTAGLLTEGTASRSATEISRETEFLGAQLSAGAGADYSTVNLSVLKKEMDKGFSLFADVLLNPSFPEDELARAKVLTKGALRESLEDPGYLASRAFSEAVYGSHPYGRDIRGTAESLDTITRGEVLDFYKTHYVPNNSVLTVAGDLTRPELDALIERHLSGWKSAPIPVRQPHPIPTPKPAVLSIEKDLTQATILFGHLGIPRSHPDFYAVRVMNFILGGGGFSSRLMDRIRDDMGLTYGIHSSFSSQRDAGLFEIGVQTKTESAGVVIDEIDKEIGRIRTDGVTERELADAKAYLTGSFPRTLDTMGGIVGFLTQVEYFGLGEGYMEKYPSYINAVTREDILRVAQSLIMPDRAALVVVSKKAVEAKPAK